MKIATNTLTGPFIELRREDVVRRAQRLWRAAGQPTGRNLEFWLLAEVELALERQPHSNAKSFRHRALSADGGRGRRHAFILAKLPSMLKRSPTPGVLLAPRGGVERL